MNEDHVISLKYANQNPQEERPAPIPPKKRRTKRVFKKLLPLALVVMVLVVGAYAAMYFFRQPPPQSGDVRDMVARVSRLMVLPDEAPTVALVSDLEKLQGQAFFARAQKGDVVLMYPKAQKAILYSPTLDKILEVAPITNDTQQ